MQSLDTRLTTAHGNLESKLIDRLLKAYKEQSSQTESLKQFHEDKLKDLNVALQNLEQASDRQFVKMKDFLELRNTSNRLRDKVDDEMEVVARNVRESKDRMGEMKRKFEMAMEKMSHLKLEDFDKLHLAVQKAEASPNRIQQP